MYWLAVETVLSLTQLSPSLFLFSLKIIWVISITEEPMQNFTTLGQLLLGESKDLRRGEKNSALNSGLYIRHAAILGGG